MKKQIPANRAKKIMDRLGLDYGNDGKTFYATNDKETDVWEFDSKKERDEWVEKCNALQ